MGGAKSKIFSKISKECIISKWWLDTVASYVPTSFGIHKIVQCGKIEIPLL